ncbi:MAG: hypothetical protein AB7S86_08335 [Hydrogenophaga sp.]|uniref:hypothetical protein n=1 Tax=Hydrogenophaga sp. TaxID=1904254 RepID=UPI003D10BC20
MSHVRRFAKTPRAWEALARPDLVGRQVHTLLLMANGRRSLQELSLLLGEDVGELALDLQHRGLLQDTSAVSSALDADEEEAGRDPLRASA